ncbi:uncharacterized protein LOC117934627 [Etheostoma cragini]|uniref:uncharacterized protein LOC117934627 n=1 Tax=Etheostoma cragini TaxID=417921 RepID=UPI00155ECE25|nr:uncharacterized protein LOC117934627 [Etheostoma cragini]
MAGLCWMVVVLVFSLSAGHTEAMDLNEVQRIVEYLLNKYSKDSKNNDNKLQFSLAVNIPENQDLTKLQELFNADDADTVKKAIKRKVYTSNNMVAAMPLKKKDDHAEARVLDNIQSLAVGSAGKSLVFYSYLSPCVRMCANPNNDKNILSKINGRISTGQWGETIFVFSTVSQTYKDQNNKEQTCSEEEIRDALKELGKTSLNYNIFRCDYPINRQFQCINCFHGKEPVEGCVKKEFINV